jgi:hypothetical protein
MNTHIDYPDSTERIPAPDPAGFARDVSPDEWAVAVRAGRITVPPIWNKPFAMLKPAHVIGLARTTRHSLITQSYRRMCWRHGL